MPLARVATLVAVLASLWTCEARAESGLSLRWDDCASAGTLARTFACDTDTGDPFVLVLGVAPPAGLPDFVGFFAVVDFDFENQTTPSWWDFPGCRLGTDLRVLQAGSDLSCPDISPIPFSMAYDYAVAVGYPGRARLRVAAAVATEDAFPIAPDSLVALCRVSITRRGTVGPAACAGCSVPVCIVLTSVRLDGASGQGQLLYSGYKQFARWQQPINCPFVGSPARASTWGALKSLFRR